MSVAVRLQNAVKELRNTVENGGNDPVDLSVATRALDDLVREMWGRLAEVAPEGKGDDGFTNEEFEEVDAVVYALAARRGAGADGPLMAFEAHEIYQDVADFVQSVLDSRLDQGALDVEEIEAAKKEADPRKAFWMYVTGPALATNELDFTERLLPAVRDLRLDDYGHEQWAKEFGHIPVPEAATYEHALAVVLA
jgi:hypothetical protein